MSNQNTHRSNLNDNLKRKRNDIVPEINTVLSKTKPNYLNALGRQTIKNLSSSNYIKNAAQLNISNSSSNINMSSFSQSVNKVSIPNIYKSNQSNTENSGNILLNPLKQIQLQKKSSSVMKLKFNSSLNANNSSLNTSLNSSLTNYNNSQQINKMITMKRSASLNQTLLPSSKPRIEKIEKLVNQNKISESIDKCTTSEVLIDISNCKGDLKNLKENIKIKKKENLLTESNSETKRKIEQLNDFIKNTNNYINNVCKKYTEKYRRSLDDAKNHLRFSENSNDNSQDKEVKFGYENYYAPFTEPKISLHLSSISNKQDDESVLTEKIIHSNSFKEKETVNNENVHHIDHIEEFCFNKEEPEKEIYYKSRYEELEGQDLNHLNQISLNDGEIEQIEILNNKIKEKEKDFDYVIENFDLILNSEQDHDQFKTHSSRQDIIKEFMEREMNMKNTIENFKSAFLRKVKDYESLTHSMNELMSELNRGESHRRKLHNYIQELRGNIRVYCRVKPVSCILETDKSLVKYPEQTSKSDNTNHLYTVEILNTIRENSLASNNNVVNNNLNSSIFHFDRVFTEASTQFEIFSEVRPFLQSALDGENVCLFAYGATGSGKTYTMQGPYWTGGNTSTFKLNEFSGILPRAAEFIFNEISRTSKFSNTKIYISAIEIYNENIYDLFEPNSNKTPLQLFINKNTCILKNLIWNQIKNKEDILAFTKEASESRRSDSTKFNENSSRSHAVFQLKLENSGSNTNIIESYINIIDLAGSEKCTLSFNNKSKEEIEAMKKLQNEANYINKSLSSLGRVISMLADKKSNKLAIPYRESKLTMLLQNSLKASSKTAMIVTICSESNSIQQSKDSLKFATNAMIAC